MKRIGTIKETIEVLNNNNLFAKKKFGQNFLIDQNVLSSIVSKASVNKNVNVVEIGPGIGSLTEHLINASNKVISYEIDDKLIPVLTDTFNDEDNFTLIHKDFLEANVKEDIENIFNDEKEVIVVANLPYYITTPIIMHILEDMPYIKKCCFMVQREVADRIVANKGGKDYNNLTIAIKYRAVATKVLDVSRNVFYPKPNVDSAVIVLDIYKEPKYVPDDEKFFLNVVKNCFASRRKTLVNNIRQSYNITKEQASEIVESLNLNPMVRSEELDIPDFISISRKLKEILS